MKSIGLSLVAVCCLLLATCYSVTAQDSLTFRKISDEIMLRGKCYEDLRYLCKQIGHRLSGSTAADKAVEWGKKTLMEAGADKVWLQPVEVPNWIRGKESLKIKGSTDKIFKDMTMLSLGNTEGTNGQVLESSVVMVADFDAFKKLSDDQIKGKIIFFDHRFPQEVINPFNAYGTAGAYRWTAPNMASARGAAAVIIRSISTGQDDFPHTGSMRYADSVRHIPAVAIGNISADLLEKQCSNGEVRARIQSECKMKGTKMSYNVIGEIKGYQYPDEIVLVGGHLDSWDVGEGAHDDGAGVVQSIEVLRTLKSLGLRPKRSVRAVLFMNEENGLKGGNAYNDAARAAHEKHIFAIETDAGGFSPRGIGLEMSENQKAKIRSYRHLFYPYGVYNFEEDEGGADISPLHKAGVPVGGLMPDAQRYFDIHHTNNDVFENVDHRELKLGATVLTQMVLLIANNGL